MSKLTIQKLCILFGLIGLCVAFGFYIDYQPRKPETSSSLFEKYDEYLKRGRNDVAVLEVYVEPVTKYQDTDYYVTVCNTSNQFVCGTLELLTAKNNVCFSKRYINLKPYEEKMIAIQVSYVPVDYKWKKVSFYDYSYPEVSLNETVSYDFDEDYGYYWKNVITNEKIDAKTCLEYVEYYYVQDILAGTSCSDIFFYEKVNVVYEEKGSQKYPDINSSYMASACDGTKIQIVDLENNEILLEKLLK